MQLRHVPPHLRGLKRCQALAAAHRQQQIERMAVGQQRPGRQAPLMAKRLEIFPDQRLVRVVGSGSLSHSGNR